MPQVNVVTVLTIDDTFSGRLPVRKNFTVAYTEAHHREFVLSTTSTVTLYDRISNTGNAVTDFVFGWIESEGAVDIHFAANASAAATAYSFWTQQVVENLPILFGSDDVFLPTAATATDITPAIAANASTIAQIKATKNASETGSVTVRIILLET